jgi:hypothetical protein
MGTALIQEQEVQTLGKRLGERIDEELEGLGL